MAEGYLVRRLKEAGIKDVIVASEGTSATEGFHPTQETVDVMKEEAIDVSGYVSSCLDRGRIDNADIILVMEPYHKEKIESFSPGSGKKVFFLREFSSEKKKENIFIEDPIGKSVDFYRKVFALIKDSIEGFLIWLREKK
ncbi:MAG: hypothetical protein ISS91_00600 [Candidatus Omnitrophica bacterium]|nr:hypothetical protein [Candidatus Omnitrophota bacterium]